MNFAIGLQAPFDLALANDYFGGWLPFSPDPAAVAMAFPVEGWQTSAAVILRQPAAATITGAVLGVEDSPAAEAAWRQALAVLSLDSAAADWATVGQRDPVIGRLQAAYHCLRPVLFHSPYEAAAAFIIGHRISIQQGRAIRQAMAQALGDHLPVGTAILYAFPRPQVLLDLPAFRSLNAEKIARLHGVARAALDGLLDRTRLRARPVEQALAELRTLDGVGPFFAQGILLRGAGLEDAVPDDDVTKEAVQRAYDLPARPGQAAVLQIAEHWRPYRMWASVLLHVWLRREAGGPHRAPARAVATGARRRSG